MGKIIERTRQRQAQAADRRLLASHEERIEQWLKGPLGFLPPRWTKSHAEAASRLAEARRGSA